MARTLYHLHIKGSNINWYYGSIMALTDHQAHEILGVGRDTLYRFDWENKKKYENEKVTIQKGELLAPSDVAILRKQ